MKRIFISAAIIINAGILLAQSWSPSAVGYIQSYPQYELMSHVFPEGVKALRSNDTANPVYKTAVEYFTVSAYSFFLNGKLYMLSYDTCSTCYGDPSVEKPITRGLFLFHLDKYGWTKVSESLQTDYYKLLSNENQPIWSKFCYVPSKRYNAIDVKDGSVSLSANGEVTIVLVNYKRYLESGQAIKQSYENKTIVLVPNNDGTYEIQ